MPGGDQEKREAYRHGPNFKLFLTNTLHEPCQTTMLGIQLACLLAYLERGVSSPQRPFAPPSQDWLLPSKFEPVQAVSRMRAMRPRHARHPKPKPYQIMMGTGKGNEARCTAETDARIHPRSLIPFRPAHPPSSCHDMWVSLPLYAGIGRNEPLPTATLTLRPSTCTYRLRDGNDSRACVPSFVSNRSSTEFPRVASLPFRSRHRVPSPILPPAHPAGWCASTHRHLTLPVHYCVHISQVPVLSLTRPCTPSRPRSPGPMQPLRAPPLP
ncbi:hypothetical protein LZ30DRAFT_217472 [Colletotrichum cereale]|nr:hypothetical protein LZ30DRAFT_217472 [Colletotrichum cereale]